MPHLRVALVMDALFSHVSILSYWKSIGIFGSIGLRNKQVEALSHNLPKGKHRLYELGNVIVSVYMDNALVANASTIFSVDSSKQLISYLEPPLPYYSDDFIKGIHQLCLTYPKDALQHAASMSRLFGTTTNIDAILSHITGDTRQSLAQRTPTAPVMQAERTVVRSELT